MEFDSLSQMPEWNDEEFRDEDEEGEEWKTKATRDACKALYKQWQQVMVLVNGALESMNLREKENAGLPERQSFPVDYWEDHKSMILADAYQIAVKIQSSEIGNMYTLRMENASIIRKNAQFIKSSILTMMIERIVEEDHGQVIRDEIDKFREVFKEWVNSFQKDEFEDEWGLFN